MSEIRRLLTNNRSIVQRLATVARLAQPAKARSDSYRDADHVINRVCEAMTVLIGCLLILVGFYGSVGFQPSQAGLIRVAEIAAPNVATIDAGVAYRHGPMSLPTRDFIELTRRVWGRELEPTRVAAALARTLNVGAWRHGRLVGAVRVLSDGYLLNTVPEVMVDPACRRQGIGRELMYRALRLAPGGRLFFGAQSGNEPFFEQIGFVHGPTGFVGRLEEMRHLVGGRD